MCAAPPRAATAARVAWSFAMARGAVGVGVGVGASARRGVEAGARGGATRAPRRPDGQAAPRGRARVVALDLAGDGGVAADAASAASAAATRPQAAAVGAHDGPELVPGRPDDDRRGAGALDAQRRRARRARGLDERLGAAREAHGHAAEGGRADAEHRRAGAQRRQRRSFDVPLRNHDDSTATPFATSMHSSPSSLTFHGPRAVYTAVAGVEDRVSGRLLAREDLIPLGSATKPFTAAGVLRLAERSALGLGDRVAPYVDPWLRRDLGGPSSSSTAPAAAITILELLKMRGGLQDYDDARYQNKTFRGEEYVPTAVVGDAPHDLHCAPGACGVYSSVGYLLLGLAAATAVNLSDWRALDQGALAFGGEPGPGLVFPVRGAAGRARRRPPVRDASATAPTAGSTSSATRASTPGPRATWRRRRGLARFWHRLFDGAPVRVVARAMASFEPLTWGWFPGLEYGAGLMAQAWAAANGTYSLPVLGHGGEDYGSETALNGYVAALNASVVLASVRDGANCSLSLAENAYAKDFAACFAYDRILHAINPAFPACGASPRARRRRAPGRCLGTLGS
ncbi:beta-lactamase [Aureococcus anophagefferens]|nr:beta-lactamase [Aureococcus anophagefferens]